MPELMAPPKKTQAPVRIEANAEVATLGGGCFWCLDAVFRQLKGVNKSESGYEGGHVEDPDYEAVCGGDTGHAEVVQVTFDPRVLSFKDLLDVFFTIHDPTTLNRQGADVGEQYRSVIFYHTPEQKRIAEQAIEELDEAQAYEDSIVTQVVPATTFWPAEEYHQDYFARNPGQGYCRAVISPKVAKFRQKWAHRLK